MHGEKMDLEQTVENSFFGRVKNRLRKIKSSVYGRIALYSLAGFLGAGVICGCGEDQTLEEQDTITYCDVYDTNTSADVSKTDYNKEADTQTDGSDVSDIVQIDKLVTDAGTDVMDAVYDIITDVFVKADTVQGDAVQADAEDIKTDTDVVEPAFSCVLDEETMTYVINEGAVYVNPSEFVIIDGDTIKNIFTGITYRFSAIDAAELDQCGTGEFSTVHYGKLGQKFVEDAFYNAKNVILVTSGKKDKYGRTLAYFIIDAGKGEELLPCLEIVNLLAWETVSFWGSGSFPPLADIVSKAAEEVGNPYFMKPWEFKTNGQPCTDDNEM